MSKDLLQKILDRTATETEKNEYFSSVSNEPEKHKEYYQTKNIHTLSSFDADRYRRVQHENFDKFWNKTHSGKLVGLSLRWMRYAAIFIVASVIGFAANYILYRNTNNSLSQHIEYTSGKGSISAVNLNDGSVIWLSSGTSLIVDQNQQGEMVARLDGEAYFDLVPNPKRKLIIDLDDFRVKDMGTRFNIRAYKEEKIISAALVDGQIDLINDNDNLIVSVKPGEFVQYKKSSQEMAVMQQDPSIAIAWKEGKFVFIDQTLAEICKELENWYNIEFQIEDNQLANTKYTSVVKRTTTVSMVLKILAVTDQIKYEIINKEEGKDLIKIRK